MVRLGFGACGHPGLAGCFQGSLDGSVSGEVVYILLLTATAVIPSRLVLLLPRI